MYRFDHETLRNVILFDRENPQVEKSDDIPVLASYCVFVRDSQCPFAVHDSESDGRVQDHPNRTMVKSYCGVPLLGPDGAMFGTICHFDFKPGRMENEDVELLESVARFLPEGSPGLFRSTGLS